MRSPKRIYMRKSNGVVFYSKYKLLPNDIEYLRQDEVKKEKEKKDTESAMTFAALLIGVIHLFSMNTKEK